MAETSSLPQELTREESLALLTSMPVGRMVFTQHALPAVLPVNFLVDQGRIVVRTGHGQGLAAAVRGAVVAFEVDDFEAASRQGWSVLVTGRATEVDDPLELERLRALPLLPGLVDSSTTSWPCRSNSSRDGGSVPGRGRTTDAGRRSAVQDADGSGALHRSSTPPA